MYNVYHIIDSACPSSLDLEVCLVTIAGGSCSLFTRVFLAQQQSLLITVTKQEQHEHILARTRASTRATRITTLMITPSVVLIPPLNHSIGLVYFIQARGLKKESTTPASYSTSASSPLFLSSNLNKIVVTK